MPTSEEFMTSSEEQEAQYQQRVDDRIVRNRERRVQQVRELAMALGYELQEGKDGDDFQLKDKATGDYVNFASGEHAAEDQLEAQAPLDYIEAWLTVDGLAWHRRS